MATVCHRPQDIYTGPYVDEAPDLLVYFDDLSWRATQDIGHGTLYSFDTEIGPDDAVHDYQGIVALSSAGGTPGRRLENADLRDIAPTILTAMGVSPPEDFEGKSLI
jgi:predicted AlkP superfamily phosphohydrolase/phosphomutase